jgi:signal transduction histidine kinase
LDAWAALAGEQDVELAASVPDGLFARSTPGHLEQVLDNLLANALDVSPEGTTISVSGSGDAVWVELHVVDQGPGMTEEERSRAFDRFWRADSSEGGSGLGLAIIGRLVGSDGGHVELRAAAGGGVDAVVVLRAATPGGHAPTRGTRTAAPSPG